MQNFGYANKIEWKSTYTLLERACVCASIFLCLYFVPSNVLSVHYMYDYLWNGVQIGCNAFYDYIYLNYEWRTDVLRTYHM